MVVLDMKSPSRPRDPYSRSPPVRNFDGRAIGRDELPVREAACMIAHRMADLEELAVKRDRGYLARLVLLLALGLGASAFLWQGLTGDRVSGCLSGAFLGEQPAAGNRADPSAAGATAPKQR
jgi:hypothetical protein